MSFKTLKKEGLKNLKKNYVFLVLICLISAFLASEFVGSLSFASKVTNKALENQKFIFHDFIYVNNDKKIETKQAKDNSNVILSKVDETFKNTLIDSISGTIKNRSYETFVNIEKTEDTGMIPFIALSYVAFLIFWYLIINPFSVILRRFFLENRVYKKLLMDRYLFLFKTKKTFQTSFTLFLKNVYLFLWNFTIIGYFIKRYAYFLVPYILAENPNINYKTAIKLSEDMMYGHRLECFKLELSFIGWQFLGLITLGFSNIFFLNGYKTATFTEYYYHIRKIGKENSIKNINLLNDKYLYEKADDVLINDKYNDVINYMNTKDKVLLDVPAYKIKLLKYFGISLIDDDTLKDYNEQEYHKIKIKEAKHEVMKKAYPTRLYPIKTINKRKIFSTRNYLACYSVYTFIAVFLICSMIGWTWEVMIKLISEGEFVNKGTLHGPWLPIYGSGCILITILLYRFRKNPKLEFTLIIVLCGFIEYYTGLFLELTHNGQRWWDYSGYFLNLNGRICAEGLLVFGLGGLCAVYLGVPLLNSLFSKIPKKIFITITLVLFTCFILDYAYSIKHPNISAAIKLDIKN